MTTATLTDYRDPVLVYGIASELSQDAELFVRRENADQELADALTDMPEWRDVVYVVTIDLGGGEPTVTRVPTR